VALLPPSGDPLVLAAFSTAEAVARVFFDGLLAADAAQVPVRAKEHLPVADGGRRVGAAVVVQ
jgi:hypothetical protein